MEIWKLLEGLEKKISCLFTKEIENLNESVLKETVNSDLYKDSIKEKNVSMEFDKNSSIEFEEDKEKRLIKENQDWWKNFGIGFSIFLFFILFLLGLQSNFDIDIECLNLIDSLNLSSMDWAKYILSLLDFDQKKELYELLQKGNKEEILEFWKKMFEIIFKKK